MNAFRTNGRSGHCTHDNEHNFQAANMIHAEP